MSAVASQITSLVIVKSTVYSGTDQRKHQSSASLAFVTGEFPAQRASNAEKMFPSCADVILKLLNPCDLVINNPRGVRDYHISNDKHVALKDNHETNP